MTERTAPTCTLISATCTSGSLDWTHGELWLCPDGLLRRSVGFAATLKHGNRRTVDPDDRPTHVFEPDEIADITAAGRRNSWIVWSDISRAKLKRGVIDHSLHLELADGKRAKFMWLRVDGGWDLLVAQLDRSIAGRFEAINKAFG